MKKMWIILGVIVLLIVLMIFNVVNKYNGLVTLEEGVESAWSQVENVYQRRADLIPNLVATVKGYASHEKKTLQGVIEARSKASSVQIDPSKLNDPAALQKFQQAQGGLTQALSKLMVVVERYPDLKANQNFLALQSQLEGSENRISVERRRFNEAAKYFNIRIRKFPDVILANSFGFEKKAYFKAQEAADKAPEVKF